MLFFMTMFILIGGLWSNNAAMLITSGLFAIASSIESLAFRIFKYKENR